MTSGYHFAKTQGAPGAPLILTFHGTGGDEHQFHAFAEQLAPGAHVVSPRGDVSEAGAARFFRRKAEGVYDMDDLALRTERMAGFIADARAETGAGQVLAFGYSNGANILASVLLRHPGLIDRAALLHPLVPWTPAPQPGLAGRPVLVTAGLNDPICPPELTRRFTDWLGEQQADLSVVWTRNGHGIAPEEISALKTFLRG